jgi:tripartite-type tricarboxylate transporter receptor subunit TctC
MLRRIYPVTLLLPLLLPAAARPAAPEAAYPSRPLRFVVGFTPGGASDTVARVVGLKLGERLNQPIVIDNRGGAGGNIATEIVARSAPDGHTLLLGTPGPLTITPNLGRKMAFDPERDLHPVSLLASTMAVLLVHPQVAASLQDLIAVAKARPGQLNYASSGQGTSNHLAAELFNTMAGVRIVHVPYKGAGQNLPALISGEVQLTFGPIVPALPLVRSGKLRALGVTGAQRSAAAPDIPTIAESGVPGYRVDSWYGALLPAGSPNPIVERLNREIVAVVALPDIGERLTREGADPATSTPDGFAAHIRAERAKWKKLLAAIKPATS